MSVRIRLKKVGRKHQQSFRLAALDKRQPRDSKVIEELGIYDPANPKEERRVLLNGERIKYWLSVGAQPSDTVRRLLEKSQIIPEGPKPSYVK